MNIFTYAANVAICIIHFNGNSYEFPLPLGNRKDNLYIDLADNRTQDLIDGDC